MKDFKEALTDGSFEDAQGNLSFAPSSRDMLTDAVGSGKLTAEQAEKIRLDAARGT